MDHGQHPHESHQHHADAHAEHTPHEDRENHEDHGQQGQHAGHEGGHAHHEAHADHQAHDHHAHHAHHAQHGAGAAGWRTAAQATLHCLTGCAIGEILGLVIGTAFGLHNGATIVLSILLAFVFGYALTMRGVLHAGLTFGQAVKVALAADTVSIIVMEIIDNTVMVTIPGAMDAGLGDSLFWVSLAGSLVLAFLITVPVNRWLIGRGKGHAVVHAYH